MPLKLRLPLALPRSSRGQSQYRLSDVLKFGGSLCGYASLTAI